MGSLVDIIPVENLINLQITFLLHYLSFKSFTPTNLTTNSKMAPKLSLSLVNELWKKNVSILNIFILIKLLFARGFEETL